MATLAYDNETYTIVLNPVGFIGGAAGGSSGGSLLAGILQRPECRCAKGYTEGQKDGKQRLEFCTAINHETNKIISKISRV